MLEIAIFNNREHFQQTVKASMFSIGTDGDRNDVTIDDELVSPVQCRIEVIDSPRGNPKIAVTNLAGSMVAGESYRIHCQAVKELQLPCSLGAGETQIHICETATQCPTDQSIVSLAGIGGHSNAPHNGEQRRQEIAPSAETLSSWFESLGQLQRSTAGEDTFFKLAARCVFNPGGLDGCIILQRKDTDWSIVAQYIPYPSQGIGYRKDLVRRSFESKQAIFHDAKSDIFKQACDYNHTAVVCPVSDADDEVVAMVYGFRNNKPNDSRKGIRGLEARYVSLIADAMSAGLIRLSGEADRARQRVLLEQAFSPAVARQLESNPDILNGQEREISVLFADIRSFCSISESIGPTTTYQLLTDIMDRFTQIIRDYDGVIIDYFGDGLAAFWNAPLDQPNHPQLAVQAAAAINKEMAKLNEVWAVEIGTRLRVGIGVHTGSAQVGNSGSKNRPKYGPQGSTVNIASRLEQSTKKIGVSVVISGQTAARLNDEFITQRICEANLPGIRSTTSINTLIEPAEYSKLAQFYVDYDKALDLYEQGELIESLELLLKLSIDHAASPVPEFLIEEINKQTVEQNGPNSVATTSATTEIPPSSSTQPAESASERKTVDLS